MFLFYIKSEKEYTENEKEKEEKIQSKKTFCSSLLFAFAAITFTIWHGNKNLLLKQHKKRWKLFFRQFQPQKCSSLGGKKLIQGENLQKNREKNFLLFFTCQTCFFFFIHVDVVNNPRDTYLLLIFLRLWHQRDNNLDLTQVLEGPRWISELKTNFLRMIELELR